MKKLTKPINWIILIIGLCLLAIYALFFLYDSPINVDQITRTKTVEPGERVGFSCDAGIAPPIDETAQAVADCLPANASPQEAAELLLRWQQIDNKHWGGVTVTNLLPGDKAELILTYHADMPEVIWNPQGKIAVLRSDANIWRVVFESPAPSHQESDGRYTLAGNWSFHPAAVGDVTGDGLDDLLVEQQWSNGTHGYESYTKLFTADSAESDSLRVLYLEEGSDTYPNYAIVNRTVQSTIPANGLDAITRTYRLNGNEFTVTAETINPKAAQLSATTADGSDWYVYDRSCGTLCTQIFGLYRM
ncbi:MAG: FG-GAP repeat protein [Anaerolineales bacterium]|nr:FG-GAP repeat protein [Anaerolineales bacterium]